MTDPNLGDLFANSGLDDDALGALNLTADNLGPAIMAGLGDVQLDDMGSTEVTIVRFLLDDTLSLTCHRTASGRQVDNSPLIIEGHNQIIDALADAKAAGGVLVSCQYLYSGRVVYPFVPLAQAVRLDHHNYVANGGNTPLYDMSAVTLSAVVAKMAALEDAGITVRGVTCIVSDADDNASRTHRTPDAVAQIVHGLLRTESHIVCAVGIDDGYGTDFRKVFGGMGIQAKWILTPGNDPAEIRRAFALVSQSAVRASQAAGAFSQTALGGFGD